MMELSMATLVQGFAGGLVATGAMTVLELMLVPRYGLEGTMEWHENQTIMGKLLHRPTAQLRNQGLLLHFLHGGLAGTIFAYVASVVPHLSSIIAAVLFGFLLWLISLAIHRRITGIDPLRHPKGPAPPLISLAAHLLYGAILGALVV
jgi:hypothetical protein